MLVTDIDGRLQNLDNLIVDAHKRLTDVEKHQERTDLRLDKLTISILLGAIGVVLATVDLGLLMIILVRQ